MWQKEKSYAIAIPNSIEKAGWRHIAKYIKYFSNNNIFLNDCKLSWILVEPQIMWAGEPHPLQESKFSIVNPHYL